LSYVSSYGNPGIGSCGVIDPGDEGDIGFGGVDVSGAGDEGDIGFGGVDVSGAGDVDVMFFGIPHTFDSVVLTTLSFGLVGSHVFDFSSGDIVVLVLGELGGDGDGRPGGVCPSSWAWVILIIPISNTALAAAAAAAAIAATTKAV
jgi:hypothetical protein